MFGHSKPLASLSSGLLARKGGARPAMRPQAFTMAGSPVSSQDDLGWNDMGHDDPPPAIEPVAAVEPQPTPAPVPVPQVLVEREALKEEIEAPVSVPAVASVVAPVVDEESRPVRPVSVATAMRLKRESTRQTAKGKAAFTLRLDAERHLRLRLASAVSHHSAQQLMTQALDAFLHDWTEVDALAAQLPPAAKQTKR